MGVKCFFIEPTLKVRRKLRRYEGSGCPGYGYHNANALFDVVEISSEDQENPLWFEGGPAPRDVRWPIKCDHCEYFFSEEAPHQLFCERVYRRTDTGEETTLRDAAPGAMWHADWIIEDLEPKEGWYVGPDGHCLMVRCPDGHDWCPDSQASNCDMKDDNKHKCWVRHGTVPNITVDKSGHTCGAGAGSIQTGKWHGFLRNGELVE